MSLQITQANARWAPLEAVILDQLAAGDCSPMTMGELCDNEAIFTAAVDLVQYCNGCDQVKTVCGFIKRAVARLRLRNIRRGGHVDDWVMRRGRRYSIGPAAALMLAARE